LEDNYYDSEEDSDDYDDSEDLGDDKDENDKGPTYKNLHKPVKASKTTKITNTNMYYLYLYFNHYYMHTKYNIEIY